MVVPAPPATAPATTALLRPHWTALAAGKDPYRGWVSAILDGVAYFANGFDQAWYADVNGAAFWPLGSDAPTSFVVADAPGGATFPIGMTLTYFLVFRNPDMGEETAPQATDDGTGLLVAGVSHTMVGTKDALITWNPAEIPARFAKVRIYRQRQDSDDVVLVAEVAASAGTYTDSTNDANLSTALEDTYWARYRLDLPPIFKGLAAYQGRLFGFTGLDANLFYSQQALANGEFVTSDFPAANILPIEPDDGFGEITAVVAHYDLLLVFKRRGCYSVSDFTSGIPVVTRMFGDRGCIGPRCVISVFDALVFLDERGLFSWLTSAEPVVVGAQGGVGSPYGKGHLEEPSPLAPLWTRLNMDAADMMHLIHNEELGYVEAWVCLDNEPQARHRVRDYYRKDRYESVDDGMVSCAGGILRDGAEAAYLMRLSDDGLLWQCDYGDAEGIQSGDTQGAVTSAAGQLLNLAAATLLTDDLLGPLGAPVDRTNSAGTVVDQNRIVEVTDTHHVRMLRYMPTAVAAGDIAYLAVIRDLWELPILDFMTGDWKTVSHIILEFDVETASVLRVDTAGDERAYTQRRLIDLSSTAGWASVPCWDRAYRWRSRYYSRLANNPYSVRAIRIDWWARRKRV